MANRQLLSLCASGLASIVPVVILYSIYPCVTNSCLASLILCIGYVFYTLLTYHICSWYLFGGKVKPDNKAVFITGCDSGFGHALAESLDSKGFRVFASCLFPEGPGADELKKTCSDKLQIVYLDVTKDESVEKALKFVKQNLGTTKLWALVNNAGIYKGFSIEFTSTDVFREVMEVNSIGPVRVTKAFLPLLRKSKGRVANVTSLEGRISLIRTCAYTMSKYAAVAFTESLSQEMYVWGVPVISIEPETFRTPMSEMKNVLPIFDEGLKKVSEEILTSYGEHFVSGLKKLIKNYMNIIPPSGTRFVIDAIESAIVDKYPNHVYKPRWSLISRFFWYITATIPFGLFEFLQFNVLHLFGYPVPEDVKKCI